MEAKFCFFSVETTTTRRQPSWELIGPDDINDVRKQSVMRSPEESEDDFERVDFEELAQSEVAGTMVVGENTGVVSEPESEKSFTKKDEDDSDGNDVTAVEVSTETHSQTQQEADTHLSTTTHAIFTETAADAHHLHHEAADIFDMNHQVPSRRERTPDPTPELPEEKEWNRADFQSFRPSMGARQYSESEFSEAELRDLARRGSEVSIGEIFQRPKSPEPTGSSSPGLIETGVTGGGSIHLLVSPEDEDTSFVQTPGLDDILEEKESSSGESDRFQQRRDVASSRVRLVARVWAARSGGGDEKAHSAARYRVGE